MKAIKDQGVVLDWTLLDDILSDIPSVASPEFDLGEGAINMELNIKVAHIDTNAAGAAYVTCKVWGRYDDDWGLIQGLQSGGGTAVLEPVSAQSLAGQTHLEVVDTTDWDTGLGERLFILDATLVNSEIFEVFGWHDNDYYIGSRNLANTHENTANLLDGLSEHRVYIPDGIRYVRIMFHNSDDNANYAVKVDYSADAEFK